jgi:predicted RNase H-like HicB family nuclease
MRYVIVIDGKPGAYGMWVPDLPGCTSMGKTIDELLVNAREAFALWTDDAVADGEKIPEARTIEAVKRDKEVKEALAEGALLAFVPLIRETGRPVKANLSLDQGLLDAIDAAAKAQGLTRSAFLASAARAKILEGA